MIFQLGKGKNGNSSDDKNPDINRNLEINGDPAFVQSGSGFAVGTPEAASGTAGAAAGGNSSAAETVRRWREAAAAARAAASDMLDPAGVASSGQTLRGGQPHESEPGADDDSRHSVEWPDPRAAITLNKPISQDETVGATPHSQGTPKPEAKSEGSLVSRAFPFFRSSTGSQGSASSQGSLSYQGSAGQSSSGKVVQPNSQQVQNQMSQLSGNPNNSGHSNSSGNMGSLQGSGFAETGGAGAKNMGAKGAGWTNERQGAPGDLASALKGRNSQLAPEDEIRARFGTNIKSALGPGTIIEGKFRFDSPVSIEGTLIGEVFSNSVLIVGAQANVTAKITVGSLIVLGKVHGDVECEELLEIKSSGYLEGDVRSKRLAIDDGGYFRGLCTPAQRVENSTDEESSD